MKELEVSSGLHFPRVPALWREEEWEEQGEEEEEEERGTLGKNVWNSFPVLQLGERARSRRHG